jgi:hypothetical protein
MLRLWIILGLLTSACSSKVQPVKVHFDARVVPTPPDYSRNDHWASLPDKRDAADSVPLKSNLRDQQPAAVADVFFVYPTIYTDKPNEKYPWNADVNDTSLNNSIQLSAILNQASIFNGTCRVFAPYYRQAHLYAFYTDDPQDGKLALELAYQDVKAAFQYYLQHYSNGRPLVIASHSQGSYHAMRLIQDFVDGKPLHKQLVVAYLVGRAISRDAFKNIRPTEQPDEVGVWASWNTFARGFKPKTYDKYYPGALSVNPLLWNTSEAFAAKEMNNGGVGLKFTMLPQLSDAQNHKNMLWINKPYVKGRALLRTRIWHRADMNLFYNNIRENVALRVKRYLEAAGPTTSKEYRGMRLPD